MPSTTPTPSIPYGQSVPAQLVHLLRLYMPYLTGPIGRGGIPWSSLFTDLWSATQFTDPLPVPDVLRGTPRSTWPFPGPDWWNPDDPNYKIVTLFIMRINYLAIEETEPLPTATEALTALDMEYRNVVRRRWNRAIVDSMVSASRAHPEIVAERKRARDAREFATASLLGIRSTVLGRRRRRPWTGVDVAKADTDECSSEDTDVVDMLAPLADGDMTIPTSTVEEESLAVVSATSSDTNEDRSCGESGSSDQDAMRAPVVGFSGVSSATSSEDEVMVAQLSNIASLRASGKEEEAARREAIWKFRATREAGRHSWEQWVDASRDVSVWTESTAREAERRRERRRERRTARESKRQTEIQKMKVPGRRQDLKVLGVPGGMDKMLERREAQRDAVRQAMRKKRDARRAAKESSVLARLKARVKTSGGVAEAVVGPGGMGWPRPLLESVQERDKDVLGDGFGPLRSLATPDVAAGCMAALAPPRRRWFEEYDLYELPEPGEAPQSSGCDSSDTKAVMNRARVRHEKDHKLHRRARRRWIRRARRRHGGGAVGATNGIKRLAEKDRRASRKRRSRLKRPRRPGRPQSHSDIKTDILRRRAFRQYVQSMEKARLEELTRGGDNGEWKKMVDVAERPPALTPFMWPSHMEFVPVRPVDKRDTRKLWRSKAVDPGGEPLVITRSDSDTDDREWEALRQRAAAHRISVLREARQKREARLRKARLRAAYADRTRPDGVDPRDMTNSDLEACYPVDPTQSDLEGPPDDDADRRFADDAEALRVRWMEKRTGAGHTSVMARLSFVLSEALNLVVPAAAFIASASPDVAASRLSDAALTMNPSSVSGFSDLYTMINAFDATGNVLPRDPEWMGLGFYTQPDMTSLNEFFFRTSAPLKVDEDVVGPDWCVPCVEPLHGVQPLVDFHYAMRSPSSTANIIQRRRVQRQRGSAARNADGNTHGGIPLNITGPLIPSGGTGKQHKKEKDDNDATAGGGDTEGEADGPKLKLYNPKSKRKGTRRPMTAMRAIGDTHTNHGARRDARHYRNIMLVPHHPGDNARLAPPPIVHMKHVPLDGGDADADADEDEDTASTGVDEDVRGVIKVGGKMPRLYDPAGANLGSIHGNNRGAVRPVMRNDETPVPRPRNAVEDFVSNLSPLKGHGRKIASGAVERLATLLMPSDGSPQLFEYLQKALDEPRFEIGKYGLLLFLRHALYMGKTGAYPTVARGRRATFGARLELWKLMGATENLMKWLLTLSPETVSKVPNRDPRATMASVSTLWGGRKAKSLAAAAGLPPKIPDGASASVDTLIGWACVEMMVHQDAGAPVDVMWLAEDSGVHRFRQAACRGMDAIRYAYTTTRWDVVSLMFGHFFQDGIARVNGVFGSATTRNRPKLKSGLTRVFVALKTIFHKPSAEVDRLPPGHPFVTLNPGASLASSSRRRGRKKKYAPAAAAAAAAAPALSGGSFLTPAAKRRILSGGAIGTTSGEGGSRERVPHGAFMLFWCLSTKRNRVARRNQIKSLRQDAGSSTATATTTDTSSGADAMGDSDASQDTLSSTDDDDDDDLSDDMFAGMRPTEDQDGGILKSGGGDDGGGDDGGGGDGDGGDGVKPPDKKKVRFSASAPSTAAPVADCRPPMAQQRKGPRARTEAWMKDLTFDITREDLTTEEKKKVFRAFRQRLGFTGEDEMERLALAGKGLINVKFMTLQGLIKRMSGDARSTIALMAEFFSVLRLTIPQMAALYAVLLRVGRQQEWKWRVSPYRTMTPSQVKEMEATQTLFEAADARDLQAFVDFMTIQVSTMGSVQPCQNLITGSIARMSGRGILTLILMLVAIERANLTKVSVLTPDTAASQAMAIERRFVDTVPRIGSSPVPVWTRSTLFVCYACEDVLNPCISQSPASFSVSDSINPVFVVPQSCTGCNNFKPYRDECKICHGVGMAFYCGAEVQVSGRRDSGRKCMSALSLYSLEGQTVSVFGRMYGQCARCAVVYAGETPEGCCHRCMMESPRGMELVAAGATDDKFVELCKRGVSWGIHPLLHIPRFCVICGEACLRASWRNVIHVRVPKDADDPSSDVVVRRFLCHKHGTSMMMDALDELPIQTPRQLVHLASATTARITAQKHRVSAAFARPRTRVDTNARPVQNISAINRSRNSVAMARERAEMERQLRATPSTVANVFNAASVGTLAFDDQEKTLVRMRQHQTASRRNIEATPDASGRATELPVWASVPETGFIGLGRMLHPDPAARRTEHGVDVFDTSAFMISVADAQDPTRPRKRGRKKKAKFNLSSKRGRARGRTAPAPATARKDQKTTKRQKVVGVDTSRFKKNPKSKSKSKSKSNPKPKTKPKPDKTNEPAPTKPAELGSIFNVL